MSGVFERLGMQRVPVLYGLGYSPWTMQARWSLDHHRVRYVYREHLPMVGEPWLRRMAGRAATASVPLLVDGNGAVGDSWAIVRWADRHGVGKLLLPDEHLDEITAMHEVMEDARKAGRALAVAAMSRDPAALSSSLPGFLPGPLRGVLKPAAGMAVDFVARKYHIADQSEAEHEGVLVAALERLRVALGGRPTLLPELTYADITSAVTLEFITPSAISPLAGATRRCFTRAGMARDFADLLAWRDRLLVAHRAPNTHH